MIVTTKPVSFDELKERWQGATDAEIWDLIDTYDAVRYDKPKPDHMLTAYKLIKAQRRDDCSELIDYYIEPRCYSLSLYTTSPLYFLLEDIERIEVEHPDFFRDIIIADNEKLDGEDEQSKMIEELQARIKTLEAENAELKV